MAKMTKKPVAEAMEKAALLQRVQDVYAAVIGYEFDEDETMLTPSELGQVITALAALFGADDRAYLWSFGTLGNFSTPFTATEWLFANGVRA